MNRATARANANIALVKYWGKADPTLNIPAMPSLSMTLDGIGTTVTISSVKGKAHELFIEGKPSTDSAFIRLQIFLEKVREFYFYNGFLSIKTSATVPYAAGLASSASFYAALTKALDHFLELNLSPIELSQIARIGSASAARSIFGAFVGLYGGALSHTEAYAFSVVSGLDLAMILAVVNDGHKAQSSREAMNITSRTSPFYQAFCDTAATDFHNARKALAHASFAELGAIMEHSTLKMHASMWAAKPSINYLIPKSLQIIDVVYRFRNAHGPKAFFTMDAGPNVKILCEKANVQITLEFLQNAGLAADFRLSFAGTGAWMLNEHLR